jgi:hypothetical protein
MSARADPAPVAVVAVSAQERDELAERFAREVGARPPGALSAASQQRSVLRALVAPGGAWDAVVAAVRSAVASTGAVVVRGFPVEGEEVVALGAALGIVAEQPGPAGPVLGFEVAPAAVPRSISTSREAFALHTDSATARRPHAYVGLACRVADAGGGGRSLLLGVDDVLGRVAARGGADAASDLRRRAYPLAAPGVAGAAPRRVALVGGPAGAPRLRYREEALRAGVAALPRPLAARWARALALLTTTVEAAAPGVVDLAAGDVLLFDNGRMLHGRTALTQGARRRLVRLKITAGSHSP